MKVFIVTLGSRGDVQPYVALGKGLIAKGHDVMLCAPSSFEGFITEHGLQYGYMDNEILTLIDSDAGREAMEETTGLFGWIKTYAALAKKVKPMQTEMINNAGDAAAQFGPDLVIYHPKAMAGPHIAEKYGAPRIMSVPLPIFTPTAEFPSMVFPNLNIGGWYNKLTYTLSVKLAWMQYRSMINPWRKEKLGIESAGGSFNEMELANGQPTPTIYPYSEHVVPRPADWPENTISPGYWFLDRLDDWQPPADLQAFLDAGPAPVYVGFGSMAGKDPAKKAQAAIDALQKTGQRGLIATGWGGLDVDALPETIFKIEAAPHDWLFERVAAVVHHGGAGTTAAGLRAGKPTVICPFMGDQPFWGRRVIELGVGAGPIPQKKLNAENLAEAIQTVTSDKQIQARAAALGEKIRAEDGVAKSIVFIESYVN